MKYYKVLKSDGSCANGGKGKWYLPKKQKDGGWKAGKWMPAIEGELELRKKGYHICRPDDLVYWLDEAIYEVEYDGEIIEGSNKCVVHKARLLRKIETWNERSARLFITDCSEHVLHILKEKYPDTTAWAARAGEEDIMEIAAWYIAEAAECAWQTAKLFEYLEE